MRASLLKPHGLATTTVQTEEQWDAPNGWAPLQWLAIKGLNNYGDCNVPVLPAGVSYVSADAADWNSVALRCHMCCRASTRFPPRDARGWLKR